MKIVLKQDFAMTVNGKLFAANRGDVVDTDAGHGDVFLALVNEVNHPYDIIESDDVLEPKELEEVIVIEDEEQSEEDAVDAEVERSIIEDDQTEIEALEAEEVRAEMEKPKKKRARK